MNMQYICTIDGVCKYFPGVKALDNVTFDIIKGEIHAIVGENGAGKSTLMNILCGSYTPTSGRIVYEEEEVQFSCSKDAQEIGIAMIHQELSLSGALSIAENIFQGRLPKNRFGLIHYKRLFEESKRLMNEVGLESLSPDTLVRDINVSQQQQVEIAKALSYNAKLLIMDEPTSALTPNEAQLLHDIMRKLKRTGITMVYISHKLDEIMEISDRVSVFRDGQYIETIPTKEISMDKMISSMVGREFVKIDARTSHMKDYQNALPILEVENLKVGHKVKDVSFKLYKGEVLGLTGLVGSGRSEVLQAVFGGDKRDSGKILVNGKELKINNSKEAIEHGLGLVAEGRKQQSLFLKLSVKDNMSLVNLKAMRSSIGLISSKQEKNKVDEFIKKLNIKTPNRNQKIVNLSGGNQQKAIIARWLLNKPEILFLDEPTQGIDVGAKKEIYNIIDLLASQGVSIIVVSSEMQEILSLCDRILVMHEGRITGELYQGDATQDKIMTLAANY